MAVDKLTTREGSKFHYSMRGGSSLVDLKPLFSTDSKYIFISSGSCIKVFNTNSGECIHNLHAENPVIVGLQINPQNNLQLLSCDARGTIIKWDYIDGTILKKYRTKFFVKLFFAPKHLNSWFVVGAKRSYYASCGLYPLVKDPNSKDDLQVADSYLVRNIAKNPQKIAFGVMDEYVAYIDKDPNCIYFFWFQEKNFRFYNVGNRELTCIAAHPNDYCLATGDVTGRIVIWYDLKNFRLLSTIYHWHTLPVKDLAFSAEGSHFFSGGGECVLVKWKLGGGNTNADRHFLPRMGMPITYVTPSSDNCFVATSHVDNAIQLINSHMKIVDVIQGLTQAYMWSDKINSVGISQKIPTGLMFDPISKAVVLNGKPGHLQFYSLQDDKQLYNLDIVGHNYLCQERHSVIYNTDVIKAAFNQIGNWLATVEYRNDGVACPHYILKFWMFHASSQRFTLSTTVPHPHKDIITQVLFQPTGDEEDRPLAVTLSKSKDFKLWTTVTNERSVCGVETWRCQSVGYFVSFNPSHASFSEDGSLLAVAFHNIVTIWLPERNVIKTSLVHPKVETAVKFVEFGRHDCSQYVVAASNTNITVWDIFSLAICWQVQLNASHLAANPFSNLMAIFTHDSKLVVFKPSNPEPLYVNEHLQNNVECCAFIPHRFKQHPSDVDFPWEQNANLVLIDDRQALHVVSKRSFNQDIKLGIKSNVPKTPFGMLIARKNISLVEKAEPEMHLEVGIPGKKEISELLMTPAHVLPLARNLCLQFINSLLLPKHDSKEKTVEDDLFEFEKMDIATVDSDSI